MRKLQYLLPTLALLTAAGVACAGDPTADAGTPASNSQAAQPADLHQSAAALFDGIDRAYATLQSLSYTVAKETTVGGRTQEEVWRFTMQSPDKVRIDYRLPQRRLLVADRDVLWEYIPDAGKAMRTELTSMDDAERGALFSSVMSRVAVDGLRVGDYSNLLARVTGISQDHDGLTTITAPGFIARIDGNRNCLVFSEMRDERDRVVIRIEASDFTRVTPNLWLPKKIRTVRSSGAQVARVVFTLSDLTADEPPDAALFHFVTPAGVTVLTPSTETP